MTQLITKKELATALRVSPRTIENWVNAKRIPCVRLGRGVIRYNESDIMKLIERRTVKQRAI